MKASRAILALLVLAAYCCITQATLSALKGVPLSGASGSSTGDDCPSKVPKEAALKCIKTFFLLSGFDVDVLNDLDLLNIANKFGH